MKASSADRNRIHAAWKGRISGCQLGKPLEVLSVIEERNSIVSYLQENNALPLRDYVPFANNPLVQLTGSRSCKGYITCSESDDDINFFTSMRSISAKPSARCLDMGTRVIYADVLAHRTQAICPLGGVLPILKIQRPYSMQQPVVNAPPW